MKELISARNFVTVTQSKAVLRCNCDLNQCKPTNLKMRVHVGDQCFHANDIHHTIWRNH